MSKIKKGEFDNLYSKDITKKEYDRVINKIDVRFSEIMTTLVPSLKEHGWFDYDNNLKDREGYFDTSGYKIKIDVGGEGFELPEPFGVSIPTRWLWEDYKEEFKSEVIQYEELKNKLKEHNKMYRDKLKAKRKLLKESIKSKLTKAELNIIKFK